MTGKLAWAILGKPSFPLLSTDPNSPLSFHVLLLDLTLSPDHSSPYLRAPLHMAKWGGGTHYLKVPLFLNGQLFHLFLSIIFLWGFLSSGSVVLQVEPITSMETHPLFSPSFPTFDSLKKKLPFEVELTIHCTPLKGAIWSVLTYVYACETVTKLRSWT